MKGTQVHELGPFFTERCPDSAYIVISGAERQGAGFVALRHSAQHRGRWPRSPQDRLPSCSTTTNTICYLIEAPMYLRQPWRLTGHLLSNASSVPPARGPRATRLRTGLVQKTRPLGRRRAQRSDVDLRNESVQLGSSVCKRSGSQPAPLGQPRGPASSYS